MPNLDRFAQGLPDPQDAPVLANCEACSGEIYPGEYVYVLNECIVHADVNCLLAYLDLKAMTIEEALGVEA